MQTEFTEKCLNSDRGEGKIILKWTKLLYIFSAFLNNEFI